MKVFALLLAASIVYFLPAASNAQTVDTLVDAGAYQLHFLIVKGTGTPILFEAGGGEDARTWKNIVQPIANVTGTTLIMYDRVGFGKSTIDPDKHGILNGMLGLETALQKLGFNKDIILVAHSQGGLYATLFASRHPEKVKAAILIDATTACFYQPGRLAATQSMIDKQNTPERKKSNPGSYFQGADFSSNINYIRDIVFPVSIPVIDFVSDYTPFDDKKEKEDWKQCHRDFASLAANRKGITAINCGHFIFEDNQPLVVSAIAKAFAGTLEGNKKLSALQRIADYALKSANESKGKELAYRHSEDDLNSWGYSLLNKEQIQEALAVFKLNVALNPGSWNVYDSYGETLLKNGQKEEAIKMYRKSLELNPKNENGKKVLENINKTGN